MSGQNYGYEKPSMGSMAQYDSYTVGDEFTWEFTDFKDSKVDIEAMWYKVRGESDEKARAAAEYWRRLSTVLDTTAFNLRRHTDALLEKWKSPAATAYAHRVGAALHSLDEWSEIASTNAAGIDSLAGVIADTQVKVKEIWLEFRRVDKEQKDKRDHDNNTFSWLGEWSDDGDEADEVRKRYTDKARPHLEALAKMYLDTYIQKMNAGGKYKGPTDAVVSMGPPPGGYPGAPSRPGGRGPAPANPGSRQGPAPTRPTVPAGMEDRPATPDQMQRPPRPDGPELAGDTTTAPKPVTPTNLPTNPPPTPPQTGPPPGTPVLPPSNATRSGPGPRPTNLTNPGARPPGPPPVSPGNPGGRAGSAPPPLGRQRGPQGNQPARPGPMQPPPLGQNRPGGRSSNTQPGSRPTTPPSLGGRGAAPGKPGKPPVRPAALGQPEPPATPVRPGQPGGAKPPSKPPTNLDGRRDPRLTDPADLDGRARRASVRSGLDGRAAAPGEVGPGYGSPQGRGPAGGPARLGGSHAQYDHDAELLDDDMWSVEEAETAAPAVIDAPDERTPRSGGPALGSTS